LARVDPGTPIDLSQIHKAMNDRRSPPTTHVAPVGVAWQPSFAPKIVVAAGHDMSGLGPLLISGPHRSSSTRTSRRRPTCTRIPGSPNPFQIPERGNARDAARAPRWVWLTAWRFAQSPFSLKNNVFVNPLTDPFTRTSGRQTHELNRSLLFVHTSDRAASVCSARSTWRCRSIRA
jgi:hypothetical protein